MSKPPPEDDMLAMHVWLTLDATQCGICGSEPDLVWAWDGVPVVTDMATANVAADYFTERAVPYLRELGWQAEDNPICPACVAKRSQPPNG